MTPAPAVQAKSIKNAVAQNKAVAKQRAGRKWPVNDITNYVSFKKGLRK